MRRNVNVSGVILAGGRSSRMGQDKALLEIGGRPLIRRLADLLCVLTDDVVISTITTDCYTFLDLPVVPDLFRGQGPMSGIHAALARTVRPLLLVVACDMPRVHPALLRHILAASEGFDVAVPATTDGRVHPLCAVYRATCLELLEQALVQKTNGLRHLLQNPSLRVCRVTPKEGIFCDSDLCNLNEYKDLRQFLDCETES